VGSALAQLIEALRYVPENRRFDSQWCPPGRTVALGSTHRVIKKSQKQSRNRPGVALSVTGGLGSQIFMTFGT
jgi:hypothetical protein